MNNITSLIFSALISSFLYIMMLINFQSINFKENIKKISIMFFGLALIIGTSAIYLNGAIKVLMIYMMLTLLNYIVFNKNKKESTIYSLVTYAIITISEILSVVILILVLNVEINVELIGQYTLVLHVMIIAISFILLNVALIVFRKIHFSTYVRDSDKNRVILYLGLNLLILSGFWIYIVSNSERIDNQMYNIAMVFILFSTNIALILFQSNLAVKEKLIKSISEEKEKRDMYIDVMEELMDNIKSFKHDYGNSIRTLAGYIKEEDMDGAMNFIKSLSDINEDEKILQYYDVKYLKDSGLKGLIISKVSDMIKRNLDFTISIDRLNKLADSNMDALDLSRVIGIIIDNAIESSELSESKKVFINVLDNRCSTEIVVSNSFVGDIDISKLRDQGYSTKGSSRGTGLYNAEQLLKKYDNVDMFTSINDSIFSQKIEIVW